MEEVSKLKRRLRFSVVLNVVFALVALSLFVFGTIQSMEAKRYAAETETALKEVSLQRSIAGEQRAMAQVAMREAEHQSELAEHARMVADQKKK